MFDTLPLNHALLDPVLDSLRCPEDFAACLNARGLYNTLQFVLRLSPQVHQLIDAVPPGLYGPDELDGETIQAYSTYLHETVHWWQHKGSTAGLVYSLAFPAQTHGSLSQLKTAIKLVGPKKPLMAWAERQLRAGVSNTDPALTAANVAVNNAVDLEFYKAFAARPALAEQIYANRYFECVGHSYEMAYGHAVGLIASTVDPAFTHVPGGPPWDAGFADVRQRRCEGFYYGSPIRRSPVGLEALFEGQARFIQLQYLAFATADGLSIDSLQDQGFLDGIYGHAFEVFLDLAGLAWPDQIGDPRVALFLLICDLAINPTAGFPIDIAVFESFVIDVDPGIRFARLCQAVKAHPRLATVIKNYSRHEYVAVAEVLTDSCGYNHPLAGLQAISGWASTVPGVAQVLEERATFGYGDTNVLVRVLFAEFVAFSRDKLAHPEFFCWAGAWMAGTRVSSDVQRLFLSHLSLFTDRADDDSIVPRLWPGMDPKVVSDTMNRFYQTIIGYDLGRQAILETGPFRYDYGWLTTTVSPVRMTENAKSSFETLVGVTTDAFEILSP